MIVYKVTNKINGKVYIGITRHHLEKRKREHYDKAKYQQSNSIFHNALLKYDKNDFMWEVINKADTFDELSEMEITYIKKYNSFNEGYNSTSGGERSFIMSDITKEKLKNINLGSKKHSDEWKQHLSETMKGDKNPFYGKKHSDVVKNKLRNVHTGKKLSIEIKLKISQSHKGKHIGGDNNSAVRVIDIKKNKIYSCIKDASDENNLTYQTLYGWLTKFPHRNKTNLRILK
jgi:group I intron endonuclease